MKKSLCERLCREKVMFCCLYCTTTETEGQTMHVIDDDLAVAQTIVYNAGRGHQFSSGIIDRMKDLMRSWDMKRFCFQGYAATLDGDNLKFERVA